MSPPVPRVGQKSMVVTTQRQSRVPDTGWTSAETGLIASNAPL